MPQETKSFAVRRNQPFNMVIVSSDSNQVHMGANLLNEDGVDLALQFSEAFVVRALGSRLPKSQSCLVQNFVSHVWKLKVM